MTSSNTDPLNKIQRLIIVSAGGTIEKSYDENDGHLKNKRSEVEHIINHKLRLPYTDVQTFSLLAKDSLDMTDEDRHLLKTFIETKLVLNVPLIVLHGTDTMETSAVYCFEHLPFPPSVPVIFTGAIRPLKLEQSDALQNITEAIFASTLLKGGIYISFHGRAFNVPGVRKNKQKKTFEKF